MNSNARASAVARVFFCLLFIVVLLLTLRPASNTSWQGDTSILLNVSWLSKLPQLFASSTGTSPETFQTPAVADELIQQHSLPIPVSQINTTQLPPLFDSLSHPPKLTVQRQELHIRIEVYHTRGAALTSFIAAVSLVAHIRSQLDKHISVVVELPQCSCLDNFTPESLSNMWKALGIEIRDIESDPVCCSINCDWSGPVFDKNKKRCRIHQWNGGDVCIGNQIMFGGTSWQSKRRHIDECKKACQAQLVLLSRLKSNAKGTQWLQSESAMMEFVLTLPRCLRCFNGKMTSLGRAPFVVGLSAQTFGPTVLANALTILYNNSRRVMNLLEFRGPATQEPADVASCAYVFVRRNSEALLRQAMSQIDRIVVQFALSCILVNVLLPWRRRDTMLASYQAEVSKGVRVVIADKKNFTNNDWMFFATRAPLLFLLNKDAKVIGITTWGDILMTKRAKPSYLCVWSRGESTVTCTAICSQEYCYQCLFRRAMCITRPMVLPDWFSTGRMGEPCAGQPWKRR